MLKRATLLSAALVVGSSGFSQETVPPLEEAPAMATWSPYCGSDATIYDGDVAAINSILSGGILEVATVLPIPDGLTPLVAYAIDYGEGHWYQAGDATYFTVPADLVTSSAGVITAQIPLRTPGFADLNPASEGVAQEIHVWFGFEGDMDVDPGGGVTGASDAASFGIVSDLPDYTLIPDGRAASVGVDRAGQIDIIGFRREPTDFDEVLTLTYSGPSGLLSALELPETLEIPAGQAFGWATLLFDSEASTQWPGGASSLTITASGTDGLMTTSLQFNGAQSSYGEVSDGGTVGEYGEEFCRRNTVPVPAKAQKVCGDCSHTGGAIACKDGGRAYWTIPYKCATGEQICEVFDNQITVEYANIKLITESCWYWYIPHPTEPVYWPIYYVKGKRKCCVDTPSGMTFKPTVKDCRTK